MTPLESAAKAYWDAGSPHLPWEQVPEDIREYTMRRMRAALLALAEAGLPEMVMDAGALAGALNDDCAIHGTFRAMCRAIAEDRG